jgi:hypothetical protein
MAYVRTEHRRLPHTDGRARTRRGSGSSNGGKKRMAKAELRPHAESPVGDEAEDEDSNERLMRRMKDRGLNGRNFQDRERDDLD